MPLEPNQVPCAGQRRPLPTGRVPSTIPKAGVGPGGTWVYPSPQMFFNALARKGKGEGVREEDMESVVHAHNCAFFVVGRAAGERRRRGGREGRERERGPRSDHAPCLFLSLSLLSHTLASPVPRLPPSLSAMNEATWQHVLAWEALHCDACPAGPKLLRFLGRPSDLSPLARLALLFGGPAPFDRHDWVVDRCGREVRYVIDFYFNEAAAGTPDAFTLRVRPALDSPGAALDRAKMQVYTAFAAAGLPCPVTGAPGRIGAAVVGAGGKQEGG